MELQKILDHPNRQEAFYLLVDFYAQISDNERESIRAQWDFDRSWITPRRNSLACNISKDRSCSERIRAKLIYASIADQVEDIRDLLIDFCVIYHSALEVHMDPVALFDSVASISSAPTAEQMRSFVRRKPKNLQLCAFALKRIEKSDGTVLFDFNIRSIEEFGNVDE